MLQPLSQSWHFSNLLLFVTEEDLLTDCTLSLSFMPLGVFYMA